MRNIFRFLCAVLLCGAASTPASAQELTVDELEMLMPGTTIETTNRGDWDFYITFNEDGTLDARIDAIREILDGGKWWAQDSADSSKTLAMFCHQFDEFGEGKKYCRVFTLQINGRTIERYKGDGTRLPKDWIITKPRKRTMDPSSECRSKRESRMRNIFRFLCAVLLCGAASTPASAQELTVDELEMLMPGTTIETTNRGDWDFYITFNEDGTLDARIDAIREILDGGKWWAQDSADSSKTLAMFCHQFDEFGEGKKYCRVFLFAP